MMMMVRCRPCATAPSGLTMDASGPPLTASAAAPAAARLISTPDEEEEQQGKDEAVLHTEL